MRTKCEKENVGKSFPFRMRSENFKQMLFVIFITETDYVGTRDELKLKAKTFVALCCLELCKNSPRASIPVSTRKHSMI